MPYRLRCKFPGGSIQAPRTLLAARGTFALSGRAASGGIYTPPTGNDEWQKLSTSDVIGQSPSLNNGWWKGLVIPSTGEYFIGNQQTWFFNQTTGVWRKTNLDTTDWHKNLGFRENYDLTYDADRNVVWLGTGGPVGWGGAPSSPVFGDMQYSIAEDVWRNVYPSATATYSPLSSDSGYWITSNKGYGLNGFDSKYTYFNGYLYKFGNYSQSSQHLVRIDPSQTGVDTRTTLTTTNPPWTKAPARAGTHLRSGFDSLGKRFWTLADEMELYTYDLAPSAVTRAWVHCPTTGTKPSVDTPPSAATDSLTSTDFGFVAELDEDANQLVAWCGKNAYVVAEGGSSVRKTWLLDWATLAWRAGPWDSAGALTPPANVGVMQSMNYDPFGKRVLMACASDVVGGFATQVWRLTIGQSKPGKITSIALPSYSGSVYGVNYNKFPYLANSNSKHTNMCYCPLDGRLYVTGGDTGGRSATDGVWSMSLENGSWRLDVGVPTYPAFMAPFGVQDNGVFEWSTTQGKFIFHGGHYGYGETPTTVLNAPYAQGMWFFDPVTKVWTQDLALFAGYVITPGTLTATAASTSTSGCTHGGLYDSVTDIIYAPTTPGAMRRYSMASMTRLSDATWGGYPGSPHVGYTGVYSFEPKPVQLGRWMYFICYGSNGTNYKYWLAKWNIDNSAYVELALPDMPAFSPSSLAKEQRLGVSNGKIVWPKTSGADGEISALWIYDPDADTWETDTQVPGYGNFICNAVASLPDGRIAMSGGVFGRQMTHMWFYEVF